MAVYTTVEREQLEEFLSHYDLGTLVSFEGILSGVVNTNYFVTTERGEYVLTLFETLGWEELPWFLEVMAYLTQRGMPGAEPFADETGSYLRELNGLPATLVRRLHGRSVETPNAAQVESVGAALATMHVAGREFPEPFPNPYGVEWFKPMSERLMEHLTPEKQTLLQEEVEFQTTLDRGVLPEGIVHTDLFRDNVLLDGDAVSGLIDFYFACHDSLLFDVAVTLNDWCRLPDSTLDWELSQRFLNAYRSVREPEAAELTLWPEMLRAAALRFWLSRLRDAIFPKPGALTKIHDPAEFYRLLKYLKEQGERLHQLWNIP